MKLRGIYPVQITVKRLDELHVEFESKDIGVYTTVDSAAEIQDCHNPYDSFALHKAALIACGIIPVKEETDLQEILKRMGGESIFLPRFTEYRKDQDLEQAVSYQERA